jgi:predicted metal-dependent enzyme (double-stranded beta helix superfamily)
MTRTPHPGARRLIDHPLRPEYHDNRDSLVSNQYEPGSRFAAIRSFVGHLGEAIDGGGHSAKTVRTVKERLSALIKQGPVLPDQVRRPVEGGYGRHLLYADPKGRFEIVVMTWSPGQETPVHDHSGIWCVEGVAEGIIDVTRFDMKESVDRDTVRMEEVGHIRAGLGQCGALIPPVEYHRIANPYEKLAITIHVYGGRMRRCRVFEDRGDRTYAIRTKHLSFSTPEAVLSPA